MTNNSTTATTSNGAGIVSTNLRMDNTIVAGNSVTTTATPAPDILSAALTNAMVPNSIIGINSGTNLTGTPLIGTSGAPVDPGIGALANNGGTTQTHRVLPGSSAANAGNANSVNNSKMTVLGDDATVFWEFEETMKAMTGTTTAEDSTANDIDANYNETFTLTQAGAGVGTGRAVILGNAGGNNGSISSKAALPATAFSGDSYSVAMWFNANAANAQTLFAGSVTVGGVTSNVLEIELLANGAGSVYEQQ